MFKFPRLLFLCGAKIIHDYFSWFNKYAKHPERYPFEERYKKVRELLLHICKKMRIDLNLKGYEYLKNHDGNFLLVANHLSMSDILLTVCLSEKPLCFVAKKETRKMPFAGKIIRALEGSFLDRGNLRQNVEVMQVVEKRLKENYCSYVIYPEGTRQKRVREQMNPMHPGSFKVAGKAKVDIIPLAEYGTFHLLSPKYDYKSNPVSMTFFPPIKSEEFLTSSPNEIMEKIRGEMQEEINKQIEYNDQYFLDKKHKKKLLHPFWYEKL